MLTLVSERLWEHFKNRLAKYFHESQGMAHLFLHLDSGNAFELIQILKKRFFGYVKKTDCWVCLWTVSLTVAPS